MFGKPSWFCLSPRGVVPVCWQGWLCAAIAAAVIVLPAWALISSGRAPESLIWLAVAASFVIWEVRRLRGQLLATAAGEDVMYLGDDPQNDRLATRNYDFHLRQ